MESVKLRTKKKRKLEKEQKTLRSCERRKVKQQTRKVKSNGNEDVKRWADQGSATHGEG